MQNLVAKASEPLPEDGPVNLASLYRDYYEMFGDEASNGLNGARLMTRAALAAALAPQGSTIVECGTFMGHDTALLAAAIGAAGRIHTFDACPLTAIRRTDALRALREVQPLTISSRSVALYDGLHDHVVAAFCSDRPGHTVVHHEPALAAGAFGGNPEIAPVATSSLDELVEVRGSSLLWIDAQGSAPFVVAGARRLLAEDRPAVVFEYAHTQSLGLDVAWPLATFGALGYVVYDFSGLPMTVGANFHEVRCWNLLAYPSERSLPGGVVRAFASFRAHLGSHLNLHRATSQELYKSVELVSLLTAARAAGKLIAEKTLPRPAFDIYSRRSQSEPEVIRVAHFPRVGVTTGQAWKPFTPDGLYMEELGYTVKGQPARVRHWQDLNGRWTIKVPPPLLEVTEDSRAVFVLGGDGAYYHWILNWLPRMMVFDEFPEQLGRGDGYRFLVSAGLGPMCIRGLEILGVKADALIIPPYESTVSVNNAVVPSFFSSNVVSPNVASWYRQRFGRPSMRSGRRLYITRNDLDPTGPPRRRVVNEQEIEPILQAFGFETVRLAELTFDEQMVLFAEASVVIGPHGAGFANLVFATPGAKVLVFENSWNHTFMVDMARTIGHKANSLLCADSIDDAFEAQHTRDALVEPEITRNRDMLVDLQALSLSLEQLFCQ